MADDPKIDEFKHAIEVLDVLHGGYALDGMSVSLMLSLKGGHSVPMVISAAAAEKMILGIQLALTKNAEKRTGVPGKVFGEILEPSSIAARAAPDGSHAILVFEAPSGPRANIRLEPSELRRVRQELKRIEEQLRRLRMKH
jgi:hypothetical protein